MGTIRHTSTMRSSMGRRWQSNRNDAGSLLAAVFIVALGCGSCLFTVAAMSPGSLPAAIWTLSGIAGLFLVIVVLQRFGKLPKTDLSFLLSAQKNRRDDGARSYEPRKAGGNSTPSAGTNQPISAEEAHQIKVTSANTWVPSQSRSGRKK